MSSVQRTSSTRYEIVRYAVVHIGRTSRIFPCGIAHWNKQDHSLARARQKDAVSVHGNLERLVVLPGRPIDLETLPGVVYASQITVPTDERIIDFEPLNLILVLNRLEHVG